MLKNITNFGRSGVADWFIQRISAIILFAYLIWLVVYCCVYAPDYASWRELFNLFSVKVVSLFALVSLLVHAWIGMWTIATDYIKPTSVRILVELVIIFALAIFFVWGVHILWS